MATLLSPISLQRVVCGEDRPVQLGYLCLALGHRELHQDTLPPAWRDHVCVSTHPSVDLVFSRLTAQSCVSRLLSTGCCLVWCVSLFAVSPTGMSAP